MSNNPINQPLKEIAQLETFQPKPFNLRNTIQKAGGRPKLFQSEDELIEQINQYFNEEDKPTLAGLAYFIGIDRQTLYNYKKQDKFFGVIKKARDHIESIYEARLLYSDKPTGVIFALKNMNWSDRQEITQTTEHIIPIMQGTAKATPLPDTEQLED
jgi:hypothetical protein